MFDVWTNRRTFDNLGRFTFELSSAREKVGVRTGHHNYISSMGNEMFLSMELHSRAFGSQELRYYVRH